MSAAQPNQVQVASVAIEPHAAQSLIPLSDRFSADQVLDAWAIGMEAGIEAGKRDTIRQITEYQDALFKEQKQRVESLAKMLRVLADQLQKQSSENAERVVSRIFLGDTDNPNFKVRILVPRSVFFSTVMLSCLEFSSRWFELLSKDFGISVEAEYRVKEVETSVSDLIACHYTHEVQLGDAVQST